MNSTPHGGKDAGAPAKAAEAAPVAADWLPRLAHDMRSPLVAIGYAAQMLRSGRAPAQRVDELFATIDRQTAQLVKLAEEVGDMLQLGRGRFAVTPGECDLHAIVREALQDPLSGGTFASFAPGDAVGVRCDRARLVQLLRHLVRLTGKRKAGSAQLSITIGAEPGHANLAICDPGAAIYESDALRYLAHGIEPVDPGVLSMSDIIARRILLAHAALLVPGDFTDSRTGQLTLVLPAG